MKSILIVGMSRFGRHLARKFTELGHQVLAADLDEGRIQEVLPYVEDGKICDCTKEEVLKSLGVANFDICFVTIGSDFQAALEVTSLAKELGSPCVITKANRDVHMKFFKRNGADEVIYSDRESAERLAIRYSSDSVFDYVQLTKALSLFEISPMESWIGKTIEQMAIRTRYRISILATKRGDELMPLPPASHVFRSDEHLIVVGEPDRVMDLAENIERQKKA